MIVVPGDEGAGEEELDEDADSKLHFLDFLKDVSSSVAWSSK